MSSFANEIGFWTDLINILCRYTECVYNEI